MNIKIIIGIIIVLIVIALIYYFRDVDTETPDPSLFSQISNTHFGSSADRNTIYYRITDTNGTVSSVHDSGIAPGSPLVFYVAKTEYNDGVAKLISTPKMLEYGQTIRMFTADENVKINLTSNNIEERDEYYIIKI